MKSITSETISREYRERLIKNATTSERKFISLLKSLKVKFNFQEVIPYKDSFCIVDFLIGNYIIEIDGSSHSKLSRKVSDLKRDAYFSSMGYTVLRIRNDELFNDYDRVFNEIRFLFDKDGYLSILESTSKDNHKALNPYDKYGSKKTNSKNSNKKIKVAIGDIISINRGKTAWRIMMFNNSGKMQIKSLCGKTTWRTSRKNIYKLTDLRLIKMFDEKLPIT